MSLYYLGLELRRMLRNPRFVILSFAFPVLLFLLQASVFLKDLDPSAKAAATGVVMVNMMTFGMLSGAMTNGGKLAIERAAGWQRQLRLTPLSAPSYLGAKAIAGMLAGLPGLLLVPLLGATVEGVHLDAAGWLRIVAGLWLGSIPFVLLGLLLGQLATPTTMQPLSMLVMFGMGFLGGLWVPIDVAGWLHTVAQFLPSYWVTQLVRPVVTSDLTVDLGTAVAVLAGWAVVLGAVVVRRYRRDGARV